MASEMQKSRVTEIQVRMDCNGCVQKIKKALHGISGIYELYIDLPQQKITIVGWADPQKIVKAIKKTRKSAIICSHTEPPDQPADDDQPTEPAPDQGGAPPPPDSANPPPPDQAAPPSEPPTSQAEPRKDPPPSPPPEAAKQSPAEPKPPTDQTADASASHQQPAEQQPTRQKDVEEVHVIYHYPPDYGYRSYNNNYGNNISHGYGGQAFRPDQPPPPPLYATHSYSTHRPSPYVTQYEYIRSPEPTPPLHSTHRPPRYAAAPRYEYVRPEPTPPLHSTHHSYNTHRPSPYVTQYEYVKPPSPPSPPPPPPPPQYAHYSRPVPYSEDFNYYNGNSYNNNGNITSVFSDENPNACTIV